MEDPNKRRILPERAEPDSTGPPPIGALRDRSALDVALAEIAEETLHWPNARHGERWSRVAKRPFQELWRGLGAPDPRGIMEACLSALERRDLRGYAALVRNFARGLANGGRPLGEVEEILLTGQETMLENASGLDAMHGIGLLSAVAAAEAYGEVLEGVRANLSEALGLARYAWPALLKTSRLLGLGERLPRLYFRELLRCAGCPGLPGLGRVERVDGRFIHRGPHLCGPGCAGEPGTCMTAYAVEAKVELFLQEAVEVESVSLQPGDICEVILLPLTTPGPPGSSPFEGG